MRTNITVDCRMGKQTPPLRVQGIVPAGINARYHGEEISDTQKTIKCENDWLPLGLKKDPGGGEASE